jgi:hypothetical protein
MKQGNKKLTFSVNSSQVSIFKEGDEIGLSSLLKSHNSGRLETKIGLYTVIHSQYILSPNKNWMRVP